MGMAAAAGLGTAETITRYTLRRGSLLRFGADNACAALRQGRCGIHRGRPLPCRLYPLGWERTLDGERFIRLEPAPGSIGSYGADGVVGDFLEQQETGPYFRAVELYQRLLPVMSARISDLMDFESTEPAEFRRVAVREAMAESGYDFNPLIEAMFDSDPWSGFAANGFRSPRRHVVALGKLVQAHANAHEVAAAAVLMAVSLGHTPAEVWNKLSQNAACPMDAGAPV